MELISYLLAYGAIVYFVTVLITAMTKTPEPETKEENCKCCQK